MSDDPTCAICGRTILAGERVHGFVEPSGGHSVCELCIDRAERLGWRPEGAPDADPDHRPRERAGWLRDLLGRRTRRAEAPPADPAPVSGAPPAAEPDTGRPSDLPVPAPDPAAPGRRARLPVGPDSVPSPAERAIARFNASEAGRTVFGLSRTLGAPWVSVGAAAGAPHEVRITVAWELSWYQWGVDLADELRPVFQLDKGGEIDELDQPARQWNACLGEEGVIELGRPRAGAGSPSGGQR